MFVRALNRSTSQPREVTLASIKAVEADAAGAAILTQDGAGFYAPHPAEMVRKALTLYTALLGGREEAQVPLPSFSPLSNLPQPQGIAVLHLDLTKERIEIVEEIAPVDPDGNINLDSTQDTVRTLSYTKTAAQQQVAEALENPQIGQTIEGKGIYMGVWEPKDRAGSSLNRKFAVYAAPEDLKAPSGGNLLKTFQDMAQEVASLRNWHGADGSLANDAALYTALRDGTGIGKWFIPPRDLLVGTDLNGAKVRDDNLYAHRNTGDFKNSFTTVDSGSGYAVWYWSCTEPRDIHSHVWTARFSDGVDSWLHKHYHRLSCRPCRVEALAL